MMMFVCAFAWVVAGTAEAQERCAPEACRSNFGFPNPAQSGSCECTDATHQHAKKERRGNVWIVTFRDENGSCGCHYPETRIYPSSEAADEGIQLHALRHVAESCTTLDAVRLPRNICPPCGRWIEAENRCDLANCPHFRERFAAAPVPTPRPPPRVEDLCSNLRGVQATVPEGRERTQDGRCVRRRVVVITPLPAPPPREASPPPPPQRTGCAAVEDRTDAERCDACVATHGRFVRDRNTREYRCDCGDTRAFVGIECLGVEDVSRFCSPILGAPEGTDEDRARHELLRQRCTETVLGLQCLIHGQIVGESGACEEPVRLEDLDALRRHIEGNQSAIAGLTIRVEDLETRADATDEAFREVQEEVAAVRETVGSHGSARGGFDLELRSGAVGYGGPASMMSVFAACAGGRGDWNAGQSRFGAHLEGDWCFAGLQAISAAVGMHYTHTSRYRGEHRFGVGIVLTILDVVVDQSSDGSVSFLGARLSYDYTPWWGWNHWRWGAAAIGLFLDISPEQTVTPTGSGLTAVGAGFRFTLRFK